MGIFSWICPVCDKSIRIGSEAHLRHIRRGIVLGDAEGMYDGYGRVSGSWYNVNRENFPPPERYKKNPNSVDEIVKSETTFLDSKYYSGKIIDGRPMDWIQYARYLGHSTRNITEEERERFSSAPDYVVKEVRSGVCAMHLDCWKNATDEEKMTISEDDPNQGV